MISIKKNEDTTFAAIRAIAEEVWPVAYGPILPDGQIDYMLEMMYSVPAMQHQANELGHHFIVALEDTIPLGFASFEFHYKQTAKTKIHKLYVLSSTQGKGIGRLLVDYISQQAFENQQQGLILNVNKNNKAQDFYTHLGFGISYEEVIDIGQGFIMDDYVMEKQF